MVASKAPEKTQAELRLVMQGPARSKADLGPDEIYRAPYESSFAPKEANEDKADFLPAPDLEAIAADLIQTCPELAHLADLTLVYLWKRKGGQSQGKVNFGFCQKASGLVKFFSEATWIIWLAADHVNAYEMTRRQVEALLHHELLHAGEEVDEEGKKKPVVAGHDFDGFSHNVERYGLWNQDLRVARRAFEQLPLPAAES